MPSSTASLRERINDVQDDWEPPVTKATVQLKNSTGNVVAETLTDSAGDYKLEDIPSGGCRLFVISDKKFRYMCRSASDLRSGADGQYVLLDNQRELKTPVSVTPAGRLVLSD